MSNEVNLDSKKRTKISNLAVNIGLITNIILAGLKTGFGIFGHSPALLADGINSTSDVAYYVVIAFMVRMAHKPADDEHPYGHSQLESIGALLVAAFVITTAVAIFWNSINALFDLINGVSDFAGGSQFTLYIALFTVSLKIILAIYTNYVGKQTQNASIIALANDHRNDIFSAMAAVVGIALGRLGYLWVDPFAGAVVSLVILRTGIQILRDATSDLMDTVPGRALQAQVQQLLSPFNGSCEIDNVQAHRFGQYLVMNITISVDGKLSVHEGHNIANEVENILMHNIDYLQSVHIHYHPKSTQTAST